MLLISFFNKSPTLIHDMLYKSLSYKLSSLTYDPGGPTIKILFFLNKKCYFSKIFKFMEILI